MSYTIHASKELVDAMLGNGGIDGDQIQITDEGPHCGADWGNTSVVWASYNGHEHYRRINCPDCFYSMEIARHLDIYCWLMNLPATARAVLEDWSLEQN